MSCAISKLAWALLALGSVLCWVCVEALVLTRRRPRVAHACTALAALLIAALLVMPLAGVALAPLVQRFPPSRLPPDVDEIVALGGSINAGASRTARRPVIEHAGERLIAAVALARHPQTWVIFSSGSGELGDPRGREADWARRSLGSLGLDAHWLPLERDSRDSWQNAWLSWRLVNPQPGQVWVLLTSAWHVPPAIGHFRRLGWRALPYPVDYREYDNKRFDFDAQDQRLDLSFATHEWIGLTAYWLKGHSATVFPGA